MNTDRLILTVIFNTTGKNKAGISCGLQLSSGFPPIREIREFSENFEDFFQSVRANQIAGFEPRGCIYN